jgi:nickel-dependent lactate racemase
VQVQAQIQQRTAVFVYSDGLTDAQICAALFLPCRDVGEMVTALQKRYGPQARICVMPEGPYCNAYVKT